MISMQNARAAAFLRARHVLSTVGQVPVSCCG